MNEALINELIAIDWEYQEVIRDFYRRRDDLYARMIKVSSAGIHFQGKDGTVFEIIVPRGKYIAFEAIDYNRTRRAYLGEKTGSLSLKRAQELGYTLGPNQTEVSPVPEG